MLLGFEAVCYRLTTGTRASWAVGGATGPAPANLGEVPNIRDLSLPFDKAESDVTTRGAKGWRATKGALKEVEISFRMVYDPADTDQAAFKASFFNGTPVALAILDQAKTVAGAEGLWADFEVMKFQLPQEQEQAQFVDVTIKPTYSAVPPQWVTVSAE